VPRIALTFDDGPSEWTPAILDLLAEHRARATFFVLGESAEARPELLERIRAQGHELGNHTWSHPPLTGEPDDRVRQELSRTSALIETATGVAPALWRAPYLELDERTERVARGLGLTHARGDVNPPDWDGRFPHALIATFVLKQLRPDALVVLHDGIPSNENGDRTRTVRALAAILPRLDGEWETVSASEVLAA
jgi:peptidoglycan/xylan/chitin deacetylase (PgdA/CDA1 family)